MNALRGYWNNCLGSLCRYRPQITSTGRMWLLGFTGFAGLMIAKLETERSAAQKEIDLKKERMNMVV